MHFCCLGKAAYKVIVTVIYDSDHTGSHKPKSQHLICICLVIDQEKLHSHPWPATGRRERSAASNWSDMIGQIFLNFGGTVSLKKVKKK